MKSNRLHMIAALVLVSTSALTGCGENGITAPVSDESSSVSLVAAESAVPGERLFKQIEDQALASLSLSELVMLTPYMTGSKTPETASLSELVQITPIVKKFQDAFNAGMAGLSAGQAVRVASYMTATGKNRYPYPVLDDSGAAAEIASVMDGETLFEGCQNQALSTMSLSELVIITPFISGSKTIETATLSEIVQVTPVAIKFQDALRAELASLSVGDAVLVTSYMATSGKTKFPYAELEGPAV